MNFTNEDEMKIVDMYVNQKLSTVKIGQYYNCYHKVIAKILDKHNIQRVGNGRRKYDLDEHYFETYEEADDTQLQRALNYIRNGE